MVVALREKLVDLVDCIVMASSSVYGNSIVQLGKSCETAVNNLTFSNHN